MTKQKRQLAEILRLLRYEPRYVVQEDGSVLDCNRFAGCLHCPNIVDRKTERVYSPAEAPALVAKVRSNVGCCGKGPVCSPIS